MKTTPLFIAIILLALSNLGMSQVARNARKSASRRDQMWQEIVDRNRLERNIMLTNAFFTGWADGMNVAVDVSERKVQPDQVNALCANKASNFFKVNIRP